VDDRTAKFRHIKIPLQQPMALLKQTSLHKLPAAVGKEFTTRIPPWWPWCCHLTALPQTSLFGVVSWR